jgi:hypothetical protein
MRLRLPDVTTMQRLGCRTLRRHGVGADALPEYAVRECSKPSG